MRVRDIMTTDVEVIRRDAPVEAAAARLAARKVTALPVIDADGMLVGMVSEGDLLWQRVPADPTTHVIRRPPDLPPRLPSTVNQVMAHRPYTTEPDVDVAEVTQLMLQHDIRSVPVVEGREVVGIVSRRDILRVAIRDDGVLTHEVQHRLDEYAKDAKRWTAVVEHGIVTVTGPLDDPTERTVVTVLAQTVPGVAGVKLPGA